MSYAMFNKYAEYDLNGIHLKMLSMYQMLLQTME